MRGVAGGTPKRDASESAAEQKKGPYEEIVEA